MKLNETLLPEPTGKMFVSTNFRLFQPILPVNTQGRVLMEVETYYLLSALTA